MDFQAPPPAGGFGSGPVPGSPHGPSFGRLPYAPPLYGPQYGLQYPQYPGYVGIGPSNTMATTAMILGILSIPFTFFCMMGLPLGTAAIIVSLNAKKKIAAAPHLYAGEGMAKAGFWCGIAGLSLFSLYMLAFVGQWFWMMNHHAFSSP